jgi:hypothetical protein
MLLRTKTDLNQCIDAQKTNSENTCLKNTHTCQIKNKLASGTLTEYTLLMSHKLR